MADYHCTLAKKYDPDKHDVKGWLVSEKLDGVRAIWHPDRQGFYSRSDKPLNVPAEWLEVFSNCTEKLDGEFFKGRGEFQSCVSAVRKKAPTLAQFEGVKFVVFDCITEGKHETRMAKAYDACARAGIDTSGISSGICYLLKHYSVHGGMGGAEAMYRNVLKKGGEGLMFRNPDTGYEMKRTGNLLKWKDEIDGIATVIGHDEGQGKHKGKMGALVVNCDDTNVCFRVGTGFSDEEREEWWAWATDPKLNEPRKIRWRAMERTRDNVPRHPAYMGIYNGE